MLIKFYLITLLICSVDGSICKPDIDTTIADQFEAINTAKDQCNNENKKKIKNSTDLHCPGIFDGIMCWPDTRAGITLSKTCPSYINGFNASGLAVRECLPSGKWYVNPDTNKTFTNFSGCVSNEPIKTPQQIRTELIEEHMPKIQVIYRVGYAISLAFLVVAVIIMANFRKLHCQRNTIHINLFISYILRCIVCFVKDEHDIPDGESNVMEDVIRQLTSSHKSWRCKLVHTVFFYILVANYMWVLAEGLYLHSLIFITTFHNIRTRTFKILIVVAWVFPVFCIVPWVIVRLKFEDTLCWNLHDPEFGFQWIIEAPIMLILFINFIFFLNIIRVLFLKLSATNCRDPKCYRKLAKSTLVLIPLLGIHYIAFMALPICLDPKVEIVWMYMELTFSSFQGLVVSVLFCFLNGEVKASIRRRWKIHLLRRKSLSTRSTRTFSVQSTTLDKDMINLSSKSKNNCDNCSSLTLNRIDIVRNWRIANDTDSDSYMTDDAVEVHKCKCTSKDDNENIAFLLNDQNSEL